MEENDYEIINERLQAKIDEIVNQIANTADDYANAEKNFYELYCKARSMLDYKGDKCVYSNPEDSANLVEKDIYELLGYFDKDPTCEYPLSIGSSGTPYLRINSDTAINMRLYKYNIFDLIENYLPGNNRSNLLIKLLFCHEKRYKMYNFYFDGRIYYNLKSALPDKKNVYDGKIVNAIPIRYADTITPINSIMFVDKIQKYIDNNSDSIKNHNINIAVFGSFSDREYHKHDLERLAEEGYFKDNKGNKYNVSITYFDISRMTEEFICFEENGNTDNKLKGNLYDINFLTSVANKYNITLFLDMGCTREFSFEKASGTWYEYSDKEKIINNRPKLIDSTDFYNYFDIIKNYIEGRKTDCIFDPKLLQKFYILHSKIKNNHNVLVHSRMKFSYEDRLLNELLKFLDKEWEYAGVVKNYKLFSRTRDIHSDFDEKVRRYNAIRKSSLYFYSGNIREYKNQETKSCLNKKCPSGYERVFNNIPLDKVTITLFDIVQILGYDYMFTNGFTSIYTGELGTETETDLEFVKYCLESKIEIDFSYIETYRTIYCENIYFEHTRKNNCSEKIVISITADTSSKYYPILIDIVKMITEHYPTIKNVISKILPITSEEIDRIKAHKPKPILEIMVNGKHIDRMKLENKVKKLILTP